MTIQRLTGETQKAYNTFLAYKNLNGEKNFGKLSEYTNAKIYHIKKWAEKWNWDERLNGYVNTNNVSVSDKNDTLLSINDEIEDISGAGSIDKLIEKQHGQYVQTAETLQLLIDILNKKIVGSQSEFTDCSADALLKTGAAFAKTVSEILTTSQELLNMAQKFDRSAGDPDIAAKIRSDDIAMELASELLKRLQIVQDDAEQR